MNSSQQVNHMTKLLGFFYIFILLFGANSNAKSSLEIDAAIESAIDRFTNEIQGAQTYLDGARGILWPPAVPQSLLIRERMIMSAVLKHLRAS